MQSYISKKSLLSFLISFTSLNAVAETNTMDGSFRYGIDLFSKGPPLRISYNSRSLHDGVFGLGWCANFEKRIEYRQNSYWLIDCELPSPQKITPQQAKKLKLKNEFSLPPSYQLEKSSNGYQLSNGKQTVSFTLKKSLLESIQAEHLKFSFQYDKNSNLAILKNNLNKSFEMILFDDQDRVITHQYSKGCSDKIQYRQDLEDQFTTSVQRICQEKNKPEKKELLLYVFSVRRNKKQQREISSIKIHREISDQKNRLSQIP